jgi:two-component system cell cycle response regulator DivK
MESSQAMAARILIIEDTRDILELFGVVLEAAGYTVFKASDGLEGLSLARSQLPDLIICDLQMPGIDGYAVVRRLRQDPITRACPIVALTACAMESDHKQVAEAGFTGHLSKPVKVREFSRQVEQFIPEKLRARGP